MGQILLTPEEKDKICCTIGVPYKDQWLGVQRLVDRTAEAQLKKVVQQLLEPCYGTESYHLSPKGYLRFDIKKEKIQALLKEME